MKILISLSLLLFSAHCMAALTVSKRVWIALESPFLVDDGYASGVILSIDASHADVEIRQLEERGERTLYGSCRGSLGGAELLAPVINTKAYVEQVPLELVSSWRDGQHRFLQREQLGVRFQRWVDQAPGLNPLSLDDAIPLAKAVANQGTADAFEMMGVMRRARAPQGFISPLEQRAEHLLEAASQLTELALLHPNALEAAIKTGEPKELLGRTMAQVFDRLLQDYQTLDRTAQPELKNKLEILLTQWATGDGEWQAPADLQLRLPFLRKI